MIPTGSNNRRFCSVCLGALLAALNTLSLVAHAEPHAASKSSTKCGRTLDRAYNCGGPGAGRRIVANSGPVTIAGSDGLVVEGTVVAAGAHITAPNGPLEVKGTWPVPGNAVGIRLLDKDDHIVFDAWQDGRVQVNKIQVSAGATITAPNGPLEVKGTWPVPGNAVGIRLLDKSNNIVFDVWQDGRTRTAVLEITGGTDISEPFSVTADATIEKGTVLVIDHEHDGRLRVSDSPYDNRVAGIASGAGGISPGITIGRKTRFRDESEVAVSGRVYCKATASNGPIRPGDLLTTSREPGHAMKATDFTRRQGAILGKAMTALERGEGLVLVLVSLQ